LKGVLYNPKGEELMGHQGQLFKQMHNACQEIANAARCVHLSSIAKAYEMEHGCQIFIMPIDNNLSGDGINKLPSFTAHCEPFTILKVNDTGNFCNVSIHIQHFIFYKPDKNIEIERYRVAHELAHLIVHNPLSEEYRNRRAYQQIQNIGRFFLIQHTKQEDEVADHFAVMLATNRPLPEDHHNILNNEAVATTYDFYEEEGVLNSQIHP